MDIHDLRRNYAQAALESEQLDADPIRQFQLWLAEAHQVPAADWLEVNAMTLATSDLSGRVSARIVLLKALDASGFAFFTNYDSDKGQQILANPHAALVFYWPHVERQVRIEGLVTRTDDATSDEYFHARPRGSQIGAVASPQSQIVKSREEFERAADFIADRYPAGQSIPRPDYWGGFRLNPQRIEFWQGRPNRLHDRFLYNRVPADESSVTDNWTMARLAP